MGRGWKMLLFFVGIFIGVFIGIFVMCLMAIAKERDATTRP